MRQLRILGLTLIAVFSLAGLAAATASATEPGVLTLEAIPLAAPITVTGLGTTVSVFTVPKVGEIKCEEVHIEKGELGEKGQTHINLGKATLNFLKCEQEKAKVKTSCHSETAKGEKDLAGLILVAVDIHLVDLLVETKLEPGIAVILLEPAGTPFGTIKIVCGVGIVEVRGVVNGLVLVSSLTEDITTGSFHFLPGADKCDESDALCLKYEKDNPFEGKFAKVFEPATEEALVPFTLSRNGPGRRLITRSNDRLDRS